MQNKNKQKTRRMVILAAFAALAYVVMLVIHIKVPPFLTLDVKDTVITLCGLYFGPLGALAISAVVPLLEFITVSDTGWYGLVMNFLGSAAFSVTASLIYKWKKTLWGAILGLLCAACVMTGVMLLANLVITPLYMDAGVAQIRALIPKLLFPFNLLKALLNVGLVLLLYKHIGKALRHAGVLPRKASLEMQPATDAAAPVQDAKKGGIWRTVLTTGLAVVLIAVSMVIIFTVLHGEFGFGK